MPDFEVLRGNEAVSALSELAFPEESSNVFQSPYWLKLWNALPGYECGILLVKDGANVTGYFPFCIRQRLGLRECYSMPMGTYGGAVMRGDMPRQHVRDSFVKWSSDRGFSRINVIELETRESRSYSSYESARHTTHVLRLNRDRESLYAGLSDNHKRNLNRAGKSQTEITPVRCESDVEEYYGLVQESAERHKEYPRYDLDFYQLLRGTIAEKELIWQLLRVDGQACVGHIYLKWAKEIISWDSCSNNLGRKESLNYSLYWHNIETFNDQSCVSFNFGSSPLGADDLVYFKTGWGASEATYFEYDKQSPFYRTIRRVKGWFGQ
jgi:hypothetical protein